MTGPPEAAGWFDTLAEGVVLVSGQRVVDLNAAAAAMLDVRPAAARGESLISVLRDHRLEQLAEAAGRGEGAGATLELRGRVLEAVAVPGALLLRDRSEASRSRRDARELLAVLSHELRTPVAAIRAVLEALDGGGGAHLGAERRAYFLGRAQGEAERLTRLLADLTVDVRPPRERTVDLGATVARAVAVSESVQRRHGVSVDHEPLALDVWVDEDKLLQVLVNLLENAAIHGPDGGRIEVAGWDDGTLATVEVRDEGEPLDPALGERLFEPQSQGGVKSKGTGLGLYIVRSLATAWGGSAWGGGRSDGRAGNAFAFTVPLAR